MEKGRVMCETVLISNRVRRLSRRSYNHRLVIASSEKYHVAQLARLNRELDSLYELIYDDWRNITEEDYRVFGGSTKDGIPRMVLHSSWIFLMPN